MFPEPTDPQLPDARPVFSRPGGKTRLLKHLLPLIPEHTCYCEAFFGGGALFFAKPPSRHEVINDIDRDLVAFMRNARLHRDALLDEMDLVLNARQEFEDYLVQPGLTEIQRAARWFIRNRLSFGGMGATFAITRNQPLPSRAQRQIAIQSLSRRLDRTTVENRSWEKLLGTYDHEETFWFLDPPYLDSGGAAYAGWSEHELTRFCAAVQALRGPFVFTFQECDQVRDLMAGFQITAVTRANGIGNRGGKKGRVYREVIITSERDESTAARKGASA
ncbi:MAG: DNA adenine methylase [Opitutaceae bacterium]|nr:DNA adenine methylase [Opitutaceae bacterium]